MERIFIISGRLQTVALKATPAKEKPKAAGASKGSWGKAAPKAATGAAATEAPAASTKDTQGSEISGDFKTVLSDGTSGFEIPVTKRMFEVDRV